MGLTAQWSVCLQLRSQKVEGNKCLNKMTSGLKCFLRMVLSCITGGCEQKNQEQYFHVNSLSFYQSEPWAKSQSKLCGCWSSHADLMGQCWTCKQQHLAHLSVVMKCSWKQITSWMFTPKLHPRHFFSRPCFCKSPKGKYNTSLPVPFLGEQLQFPCAEQSH